MQRIRNITVRILIIIGILLASNWVYKRFFYTEFLKYNGLLLYRLQRSLNADYLYFSASSDYSFHPTKDTDTTRVSLMLMDYVDHSVKTLSDGAHHAGVFKQLVKHIPENSLTGIIVAMNIRSFSPEWLTDPNENALQKYAFIYTPNQPLVMRFLTSLNNYPIKTLRELKHEQEHYFETWQLPYSDPKNCISNWCDVEKYGDWKHPVRQLADHYIKSYAFVIDQHHQRIEDFDDIVQIAQDKKLNLIFHILPEDIQEADSLIGKDLTRLIKGNRNFLLNRYHDPENKVWVVDNLEKVKHQHFTDRDFPTEHYDQTGRRIIAKEISKTLNQIQ